MLNYITMSHAKKLNITFIDRIGNVERYGNGTGQYWFVVNKGAGR